MARFPKKTAYVTCDGGERCHSCTYGCMSCSSCIEVCRKDAVFYNEYGVAEIEESRCIGCGICARNCPADAVEVQDNVAVINDELCLACGNCAVKCPRNVIRDTRGIILK